MRNKTVIIIFLIYVTMNVSAQVKTTDSTFINNSRPIVFVVNRTDISESDKDWINNFLIPELEALGDRDIILANVLNRFSSIHNLNGNKFYITILLVPSLE